MRRIWKNMEEKLQKYLKETTMLKVFTTHHQRAFSEKKPELMKTKYNQSKDRNRKGVRLKIN